MVNGRKNPNVVFTHNDYGNEPRLFAVDKSGGDVVGNWQLEGVDHDLLDYEDISNGPGPKPDTNYIHLCDIGANQGFRVHTVRIHRVEEPSMNGGGIGTSKLYPQTLTLRYPRNEEPNAEACMVCPDTGYIYIITKRSSPEDREEAKIYKTPLRWGDGDMFMELDMVGTLKTTYKPATFGHAITGCDISPNGREIITLFYGGLEYRCRDVGETIEAAFGRFGLAIPSYVEEPQGGESIAFSSDMSSLISLQESGGWENVPLYEYPATLAYRFAALERRQNRYNPTTSAPPATVP